MRIPEKVPGLRWLTLAWVVYGLVWMALEGKLWQVVLLAVLTTAVAMLTLAQRALAGRILCAAWWLAGTAVAGACSGLGSSLLALVFMAFKTGLHAHGPEFSAAEIHWVMGQIPLWAAAGLLAGFGLGLLVLGVTREP